MWVSANIMGQVATAGQFGGTIGMYEPHSALEDTKILAGTAAANQWGQTPLIDEQKVVKQLNRKSDKLAKGGDRKSDEFKRNNG
jgi:hypothetical protein